MHVLLKLLLFEHKILHTSFDIQPILFLFKKKVSNKI